MSLKLNGLEFLGYLGYSVIGLAGLVLHCFRLGAEILGLLPRQLQLLLQDNLLTEVRWVALVQG